MTNRHLCYTHLFNHDYGVCCLHVPPITETVNFKINNIPTYPQVYSFFRRLEFHISSLGKTYALHTLSSCTNSPILMYYSCVNSAMSV